MDFLTLVHKVVNKPRILFAIPLVYLLLICVLKWKLSFNVDEVLFFIGGIFGIYLLDIAEQVFEVHPSPFRTIVFILGLEVVTFYTISSTREMLATGLVMTMTLMLMLYQLTEWRIMKNLHSWYTMLFGNISLKNQKIGLAIFIAVIVLQSLLFAFM